MSASGGCWQRRWSRCWAVVARPGWPRLRGEPNTLIAGAKDLAEGPILGGRIRRPGVGPEHKIDLDPELVVTLDSLVEPERRGDPMSPLRLTLKSTRVLAAELTRTGHKLGANLVGDLLHYMGQSLQANAKVTEGAHHVDRDGQFAYINDTAAEHLAAGQPVISVDCKKKELVGDSANGAKGWEPEGRPTRSEVQDFPDEEMQGDRLRGTRHRRERGVGERRRRPRHPRVRGRLDRTVVGTHGQDPLPRRDTSHDRR